MPDALPRMTADQRRALRAAITANPQWRTVAGSMGLHRDDGQPIDASGLRAEHYPGLCQALGIDVHATIAAGAPAATPRPVTPPPVAQTPEDGDPDAAIDRGAAAVAADTVSEPDPDPVAAAVREVTSGDLPGLPDRVAALAERAITAERDAQAAQAARDAAITDRDAAMAAPAAAPVSGAQAAPVAARPRARMVDPARDAANVLGMRHKSLAGRTLQVWNDPHAPAVDTDYVWSPLAVADLCVAERRGRNVWLFGMAGTGKSTMVEQYAARTGRGYVRIGCHADLSADEIIGGKGLAAGSTFFERGSLVEALTRPGCTILIDEITTVRPAILSMLQGILDGLGLTLPDGSHVMPAEGVRIFVADNTAGTGDSTGLYAGTQIMNAALVDRFAVSLHIDYLPPAREAAMLSARTGLRRDAATVLVEFATATRQAARQGVITAPVGPRRLISLAEWIDDGIPPARAFDVCLFARLPDDEAEEIRQLYNAKIDPDRLASLAAGTATAPADNATPNQAAPEFGAAPADGLGSV